MLPAKPVFPKAQKHTKLLKTLSNKERGGDLLVSTQEDMLSKDGQLWMHWSQWGLGRFAVVCRTRHMSQLSFSVQPICPSGIYFRSSCSEELCSSVWILCSLC